jgi:hypothetical protein
MVLDLPSGPHQDVVQKAYPRNLQLTSEHKLEKAGSSRAASKEESEEPSGSKKDSTPQGLVGSSDPSCVKQEPLWSKALLGDNDQLTRTWYLKSRIGVGMEALSESLPSYSEKDLVVAHRKNDKGVWRGEVWTKRDFEPLELLLAPYSSQLKDTHLMATAHAVVSIPKNGRGAHPENQSLALDGRTRTLVAQKGSIDDNEHIESLYWLVQRTPKPSEANLTLEQITWEQKISLTLPNNKKRKIYVDWGSSELPAIPILLNKKAIAKHTKLMVFQAEKKKEPEKKTNYE